MNELLPVLITRLTDTQDRAYLGGVALAHEVAHVPLVGTESEPERVPVEAGAKATATLQEAP